MEGILGTGQPRIHQFPTLTQQRRIYNTNDTTTTTTAYSQRMYVLCNIIVVAVSRCVVNPLSWQFVGKLALGLARNMKTDGVRYNHAKCYYN